MTLSGIEHLENTHLENSIPINKILISVIQSNVITLPNSGNINHTAETSLTEPISTGTSGRLRQITISREVDFYGKKSYCKVRELGNNNTGQLFKSHLSSVILTLRLPNLFFNFSTSCM